MAQLPKAKDGEEEDEETQVAVGDRKRARDKKSKIKRHVFKGNNYLLGGAGAWQRCYLPRELYAGRRTRLIASACVTLLLLRPVECRKVKDKAWVMKKKEQMRNRARRRQTNNRFFSLSPFVMPQGVCEHLLTVVRLQGVEVAADSKYTARKRRRAF